VSCAKTAEPIEMQFGMLRLVGPGTCITWGIDAPRQGALLGCLAHWKALAFGWVKGSVQKNGLTDLNDLYVVW